MSLLRRHDFLVRGSSRLGCYTIVCSLGVSKKLDGFFSCLGDYRVEKAMRGESTALASYLMRISSTAWKIFYGDGLLRFKRLSVGSRVSNFSLLLLALLLQFILA